MKLVLDACVLVPPVLRSVLIGCIRADLISPIWSDAIIAEWRHAADRLGDGTAMVDANLLQAAYRQASVTGDPQTVQGHLPDPDDAHVIATAIAANADGILTLNTKDFPLRVLGAHGLTRSEPDLLLTQLTDEHPDQILSIWNNILKDDPEAAKALKKLGLRRFLKRINA